MAIVKRAGRLIALCLLPVVVALIALNAVQSVEKTIDAYEVRIEDRDAVNTPAEDYVVFYAAGQMVRDGRGNELYDVEAFAAAEHGVVGRPVGGTGVLAYFNPPFVAAFWAPLTLFSLDTALVIWAAILIVLIVGVAVGGPWLLGFQGKRWLFASVALMVAEGTITVVYQGQLTAIVVAGWVLFAGFMHRGQKVPAGACLALALVKPHYVVLPLAYLAWKRERAALTGFSAFALPLLGVSLAVSGIEAVWEYPLFLYKSVAWEGINGVTPEVMIGWHGWLYRAGAADLTPVAAVITLAVAAVGVSRSRSEDLRPYAVLLVASLLISTHLYPHDMALLTVAAWFAFGWLTMVFSLFAVTLSFDYQTWFMALCLGLWSWRLWQSGADTASTLEETSPPTPMPVSSPAERAA